MHVDAVESPSVRASSSSSFASCLGLRHRRVERQVERHLDDGDRDDARAPLGREAAGDVERLLRLAAGRERHEDVAVLERGGRAEHERRAHGRGERLVQVPPVERVEDEAGGEPARDRRSASARP